MIELAIRGTRALVATLAILGADVLACARVAYIASSRAPAAFSCPCGAPGDPAGAGLGGTRV